MFHVAHLSVWDMIFGKPALPHVRATISAGTAPVTIQPSGMDRFSLRMWRGNPVTDQKCDLSTAANSILARADELAVRAVGLENRFNPVVEFAALFRKEIPRELLPLQKIYHKINIISGSSCISTYQPSGDRFKQEITDKIHSVEVSGRAYSGEEDTIAVVTVTLPKRDRPNEPRFLLDCRPRHAVTIRNHTLQPNTEEATEFVAARPQWSKIDITDGYYNIQIEPDSEKHSTILCYM